MVAGGAVPELAGLGQPRQRFQLSLVNLGDRLVDLVLQHASLIRQDDLVPAQFKQVCASCSRLVLIERLDKEVGGARLERFVADTAVVDHGDHDNRDVYAVGQGAKLPDQLHPIELGQLVVGQDHVDPVAARKLQCPTWRVEQLEVELAIDLPHDLRQQQPAAEEVVNDDDRVALRPSQRQLGNDAGFTGVTRLSETHGISSQNNVT